MCCDYVLGHTHQLLRSDSHICFNPSSPNATGPFPPPFLHPLPPFLPCLLSLVLPDHPPSLMYYLFSAYFIQSSDSMCACTCAYVHTHVEVRVDTSCLLQFLCTLVFQIINSGRVGGHTPHALPCFNILGENCRNAQPSSAFHIWVLRI